MRQNRFFRPTLVFFLFSALFFVCPVLASQQPNRPASVDPEAAYIERHRVWVLARNNREVVWYASGAKKSEGNLDSATRTGMWNFWYENGKIKGAGAFSANLRTGPWKLYYESGALNSEGEYRNNAREGRWTFYYATGVKEKEGEFHLGQKSGAWTSFYLNGQVFYTGRYTEGVADGQWEYFFENGRLHQRGTFDHDIRVGSWTICVFSDSPCNTEVFNRTNIPRPSGLPSADEAQSARRHDPLNPAGTLDSMDNNDSIPDDVPPSARRNVWE